MTTPADETQLRAHLAAAVLAYQDRQRRDGRWTPPGLMDFALTTDAPSRGQERPEPDRAAAGRDAERVLLDYPAAAARLALSVRTLRRMVAAGLVPVVRPTAGGRAVRFRLEDLRRAYVRDGSASAVAPGRETAR